MLITLIILVLSAAFFVAGKVRSDIVALCALIGLLIFQILTPEEALSGFSNSVVIMMVGLFVVGGAIFQTGLAKMISSRILKLAGKSELKLFLLVMLVTSAIGAFVSNTGTVALMLPIVVSLALSAGMNPSRLLMPLAFASSMGGMMTLIGTPPNLVIQNTLTGAGFEPLSFFSFLPVGIVCVIVGTLVLMPLTKWFLSKKGKKNDGTLSGKSLDQLVQEYGLSSNLFRLRAVNDSRLIGKTIIDLDVRRKYGLNIIEVRRVDSSQHRFLKTITQKLASPDTTIWVGDVLYITGEVSNVNRFAEDFLMEMLDGHTTEEASKADKSLDFYDIGIAEIVLMPSSNIVNRTVKEAGFRDKFNVNVLGIRRKKEYILRELGRERMHSGDVLLVQGAWQDIARISREDSDWVVLGQPLAEAAKVTLDYKAPIAAAIMVLMVAMMVFDFIPVAPVTAVMIAGLLMVLTGCFRNVEAAYKTINWETIVLFAAMLPMSLALEKNRCLGIYIQQSCERIGQLWSYCVDGRYLFHHFIDDHVHQQYGDGSADGPYCSSKCGSDWSKSRSVLVCRDGCGKHVFRFSILYTAQCTGDAGRTIYIHGLYKSGAPVADYYGSGDGICVAVAVSFLIKYMTTSLCCNIRRGLRGITRTMQIEFLKSA